MERLRKTSSRGNDDSVADERRCRKRAKIVDAGKEVFFREGYSGASMTQIAALAGGSKGTIYSYFSCKEELFKAVIERAVAPLRVAVAVQAPAIASPECLHRIGCAIVRVALSPEVVSLQRVAIAEAARFPTIGRAFYDAGITPLLDGLQPHFETAKAEGVLHSTDARDAAFLFAELCVVPMLRPLLLAVTDPPDHEEIERHVRDVVTMFMSLRAGSSRV